jgi:phage/plasmid-like protein (TIGR03299 family)
MNQPIDPTQDPTFEAWGNSYDVMENKNTHHIDETVTGGAFASIHYKAWHNLGSVWNPAEHNGQLPTSLELLRYAKADYPIYKVPVMAQVERRDAEGQLLDIEIPESQRQYALLRDHPETGRAQILGVVGKDYPTWNPREILCGFGDALLKFGQPQAATAGVLDEGRKVFMAFELPDTIKVGGDDEIKFYMTVDTSFDTSSATFATLTDIRTVCANTLRAGKRTAANQVRLRKTKNANLAELQSVKALELVKPYLTEVKAEAEAMLTTKVSNDLFHEIILREFGPGEEPSKKSQSLWETLEEQLMNLFTKADTHENSRNTAWAGYNTIIEQADWHKTIRGYSSADPLTVATARFERSFFGNEDVDAPKLAARRVFRELAGLSV